MENISVEDSLDRFFVCILEEFKFRDFITDDVKDQIFYYGYGYVDSIINYKNIKIRYY